MFGYTSIVRARGVRFISLALMAGLIAACQDHEADKLPTKQLNKAIISTSLCADSYLLAMAEMTPALTHSIGALSWQSGSALSRAPEALRKRPQAGPNPETIAQLTHQAFSQAAIITGPQKDTALAKLYPDTTVHIEWGEDFQTVWDNFARLSARLDVPNPSPQLQARLDALPNPPRPIDVLYLDRSGATAGTGTFVDAVFRQVGLNNIITTSGWQTPDSEYLLSLKPDLIVSSFMSSDYIGVNDRALRHRAIAKMIETTPKIDIAGALWPCAGPGLIDAAAQISKGLSQL